MLVAYVSRCALGVKLTCTHLGCGSRRAFQAAADILPGTLPHGGPRPYVLALTSPQSVGSRIDRSVEFKNNRPVDFCDNTNSIK